MKSKCFILSMFVVIVELCIILVFVCKFVFIVLFIFVNGVVGMSAICHDLNSTSGQPLQQDLLCEQQIDPPPEKKDQNTMLV